MDPAADLDPKVADSRRRRERKHSGRARVGGRGGRADLGAGTWATWLPAAMPTLAAAFRRPPLTDKPASAGRRSTPSISASLDCAVFPSGSAASASAAAPLTCGAAIDVPLTASVFVVRNRRGDLLARSEQVARRGAEVGERGAGVVGIGRADADHVGLVVRARVLALGAVVVVADAVVAAVARRDHEEGARVAMDRQPFGLRLGAGAERRVAHANTSVARGIEGGGDVRRAAGCRSVEHAQGHDARLPARHRQCRRRSRPRRSCR